MSNPHPAPYPIILPLRCIQGVMSEPGLVLDNHLTVSCRIGCLRLKTLQREGRRPMSVETLLRGFPIKKGSLLT